MTERMLIRGLLLGAMAAGLGGCYGGYEEPSAPSAYGYGYGYESAYPAYGYYYAPYDGPEGQDDLGPRGGKGL